MSVLLVFESKKLKNLQHDKEKYDLDLGRHKRHGRTLAGWALLIKIAVGVGLIFLVYYLTQLIIKETENRKEEIELAF